MSIYYVHFTATSSHEAQLRGQGLSRTMWQAANNMFTNHIWAKKLRKKTEKRKKLLQLLLIPLRHLLWLCIGMLRFTLHYIHFTPFCPSRFLSTANPACHAGTYQLSVIILYLLKVHTVVLFCPCISLQITLRINTLWCNHSFCSLLFWVSGIFYSLLTNLLTCISCALNHLSPVKQQTDMMSDWLVNKVKEWGLGHTEPVVNYRGVSV